MHRYTGGVPRLINTLCDTALLCAFADGKPTVGIDDIMAAIAELDWKEHVSATGLHEQLTRIKAATQGDTRVTQVEVRADGETVSVQSFPPGRIIVGRSPDNEIYIKSKFVSRHHAQLISDDRGCIVEDLNSTNGVFIGDKQIKKHRLKSGDVVSVGIHELVYTDLRQVPETDQMGDPGDGEAAGQSGAGDDGASAVSN